MNGLTSNSALMLQQSMRFLWTKQSCILDNIGNVETPGYQRKYATFEEALDGAIRRADENGSGSAGMRAAIAGAQVEVHEAPDSTRMDENGVNVTEQMVEVARNAYQLQYVMQAISTDFGILRTAITG